MKITRKEYLAAKKIVDGYNTQSLDNKIVVGSRGFGRRKHYNRGDVVVWRGGHPCIGKIKSRCKNDGISDDCFVVCDTHNSLHYSNLRIATEREAAILGRKQMILIK